MSYSSKSSDNLKYSCYLHSMQSEILDKTSWSLYNLEFICLLNLISSLDNLNEYYLLYHNWHFLHHECYLLHISFTIYCNIVNDKHNGNNLLTTRIKIIDTLQRIINYNIMDYREVKSLLYNIINIYTNKENINKIYSQFLNGWQKNIPKKIKVIQKI